MNGPRMLEGGGGATGGQLRLSQVFDRRHPGLVEPGRGQAGEVPVGELLEGPTPPQR